MDTPVTRTGSLLRWGSALLVAGLITQATLSVAAPDPACVDKAAKTRADELKRAYNDYAKEMVRITDKLADDEGEALKIVGVSGQNELSRAQASHTNDMNEANRNLSYKVQQAWANYNAKLGSCGFSVGIPAQTYHGAYYDGAYRYGQNPYGYQAPWYGNYGHYNFYGQGYCPQIVMTTLPAGCGYECKRDDRGCQTCEVSCRNVDTQNRPNCFCPEVYSPVCGRDGRSYTNSCYALCADVGLAYGGVCR